MTTTQLTSKRHAVQDLSHAIEFCYQQGWTDGLPVVPPTEQAVRTMLDAAGLEPGQELCFITNRQVSVTAEKVAVNAVMAGCLPEHMPIVVAAVEGLGDPKWGYHGPATSTGGAAVLMIVNGPIAARLGFNSGDNLFGPGWRSNATTGRAVRLVMRNVIGTLPGALDRGTVAHPGKYSYVIAENETESPWTPLHVERGCRPEQSAVTVMAALAPHQFYNQLSSTAAGILTTLCDTMRSPGMAGQPNYCVVLAGEHMRTIAADGWSKADIRAFVFENSKSSIAHFKRTGRAPGPVKPEDESTMRPIVMTPEDILVVAAGGRAGSFSCYIPGWATRTSSQAVTVPIKDRR
ncbi:MAG TPA: hypothetical protein VKV41_19630 [Methylomirabilota bacterium]|nr:hypothetical protein [Methylomirabilota bacterium]